MHVHVHVHVHVHDCASTPVIGSLPVLVCRSCLHWHPCLPYQESSSDRGYGSMEEREKKLKRNLTTVDMMNTAT